MRLQNFCLAFVLALAVQMPVLAQSANHMSATDDQFAKLASEGNSGEVQLAQLAEKKASSQDVKDFARKLESDHRKSEEQLKQWATRNGMSLPTNADPSSQSAHDKLAQLAGSDFDEAFVKQQVQDYQQDIQKFKKESSQGQNPELKAYAADSLPTLQEHLRIAQALQQKIGPGA